MPTNQIAYTDYHVKSNVQYVRASDGFYKDGHCWIRIKYRVLRTDSTLSFACTQWKKYYPSTDLIIPDALYLPNPSNEYRWEAVILPDQKPVTWTVSFFEEVS